MVATDCVYSRSTPCSLGIILFFFSSRDAILFGPVVLLVLFSNTIFSSTDFCVFVLWPPQLKTPPLGHTADNAPFGPRLCVVYLPLAQQLYGFLRISLICYLSYHHTCSTILSLVLDCDHGIDFSGEFIGEPTTRTTTTTTITGIDGWATRAVGFLPTVRCWRRQRGVPSGLMQCRGLEG